MLRLVSALPLRQTEGFLKSILALMGVDLRVPDHTTLCRRQGDLNVDLPVQSRHAPIHLVVDSTGLKGYGEGEGLKSRGKGTNLATTTFMQQRRCQLSVPALPRQRDVCPLWISFIPVRIWDCRSRR